MEFTTLHASRIYPRFGALTEAFAEEAQQAVECVAVIGRRLQDMKQMSAGNSVG